MVYVRRFLHNCNYIYKNEFLFQNNCCVVKLKLVIFIFFKEYQYFIYAGACAVLLALLFIVCVCCCRKKRRSTPKSRNKNPLHGITNYAMVNHFYTRISNIGVQSFIILKKWSSRLNISIICICIIISSPSKHNSFPYCI